jgi:hypothetical protein
VDIVVVDVVLVVGVPVPNVVVVPVLVVPVTVGVPLGVYGISASLQARVNTGQKRNKTRTGTSIRGPFSHGKRLSGLQVEFSVRRLGQARGDRIGMSLE